MYGWWRVLTFARAQREVTVTVTATVALWSDRTALKSRIVSLSAFPPARSELTILICLRSNSIWARFPRNPDQGNASFDASRRCFRVPCVPIRILRSKAYSVQFVKRNSYRHRRLRPQVSALPLNNLQTARVDSRTRFLIFVFVAKPPSPQDPAAPVQTLLREGEKQSNFTSVVADSLGPKPAGLDSVGALDFGRLRTNRQCVRKDAEKSPMVQIRRHAHALPL